MKTQVQFETYPVNSALDPAGGYSMRLKDLQMVNDDSVFEEVVKEKTLPFSPELLEFSFRSTLATMASRVSKDCRPRKIGNYLKVSPHLRGKLAGPYSAYDPNTCSCAIVFTSLSGLEKTVDTNKYVQFVNSKTGTKVTIDRITYEGEDGVVGAIMKGKAIVVTGLNCQWLNGDSCTLTWTDAAGVMQSASIVPTASSVTEMRFAWPSALNGVAAGSEIVFDFRTRGGIEEAEPQPNRKTVTLLVEVVPKPETPVPMTVANEGGKAPRAADVFIAGGPFEPGDDLSTASFKFTAKDTAGNLRTVPLSETAYEYAGLESGKIRLAVSGTWTGDKPWGAWVDLSGTCTLSLRVERAAKIDIGSVTAPFAEA